ncbi:MAG: hypothetical protein HQ518_13570 [Rhodopirellula sp.]|nr:hypothetical protein [Rhodopirellula sp.]
MNCREVCEQLESALDERRVISRQTDSAGDADVVAHAESCPDCRVLYEEHLLIESALAAWTPHRPGVDLTDRVIEAARQEGLISSKGAVNSVVVDDAEPGMGRLRTDASPFVQTTASVRSGLFGRPSRLQVLSAAVTAALILIASLIVFNEKLNRMARTERPPQQLFPGQQPRQLDGPQDQLADIGHLVADAQSAWKGITSRVSHQASGFSVFVPDLTNELGISDVADSLEIGPRSSGSNEDVEPRQSTPPTAFEKAFEFLFDDAESASIQTI